MHGPNHALRSYQQVGAAAHVAAAEDPVRLIQLLLTNACERLAAARGHLERGETAPKAEQMSRAVAVIDTLNGLVDLERGGDVARNLRALYDFATERAVLANLRNDARALDDASRVLREIKAGWDALAAQPRAAAGTVP
jgi:flagellar protein FliS